MPQRSLLLPVILSCLMAGSCLAAEPAKRPNIIFFLVDDLGWRDVGYAGSDFYETPNIDRLARDGMVFNQGYVAFPRCAPSRYGILTGCNPARGRVPGGSENLDPSQTTFAEVLKDAGYKTFFAGKWHLAHSEAEMPEKQGFDINVGGGSAGAPGSHFFPYGAEKGRAMGPGLESGKEGEYLADRLTDEAVAFLKEHAKADPEQPFLLYLSQYGVHTPFEAPPGDVKHFRDKLEAQGAQKTDEMLEQDGETKATQDHPVYAAMVANMDRSLGRIRETLDQLGLASDTIIIVTSDNGGLSNRGQGNNRSVATSNLPLRAGKGHVYEGGIRVPLAVYWPGITRPGSASDVFVNGTDHFPTILEMAGLGARKDLHLDGRSYAGALAGKPVPEPWPVIWYSPRPRPGSTGDTAAAAIRVDRWKFIKRYGPGEKDELFDLSADPSEKHNLAESLPDTAGEMRGQLESWLAAIDAVPPELGKSKKRKDK